MAEITLTVPNENCEKCDFLMHRQPSYTDNTRDADYCRLFSTPIYKKQKCLSCKLFTTRKGGAE